MSEEWEAYYHNDRHWVVHTDTALIADCFNTPDSKANAHLIAAAPEMYELLKVWVSIQAQPTLMNAREKAKELLARIDGKEADHD